jgi:hypothetical protein
MRSTPEAETGDVAISAITPSRTSTCAFSRGGRPVPSISVPPLIRTDWASRLADAAAISTYTATVTRTARSYAFSFMIRD